LAKGSASAVEISSTEIPPFIEFTAENIKAHNAIREKTVMAFMRNSPFSKM
jgi:hypothetical protein